MQNIMRNRQVGDSLLRRKNKKSVITTESGQIEIVYKYSLSFSVTKAPFSLPEVLSFAAGSTREVPANFYLYT
jgi:hypothetical protein